MRRVNLLPLGIAHAALPLVWAVQHWLRPGRDDTLLPDLERDRAMLEETGGARG